MVGVFPRDYAPENLDGSGCLPTFVPRLPPVFARFSLGLRNSGFLTLFQFPSTPFVTLGLLIDSTKINQ